MSDDAEVYKETEAFRVVMLWDREQAMQALARWLLNDPLRGHTGLTREQLELDARFSARQILDALSALPARVDDAMVRDALRAWWDDRSPGNDPRPAMRAALEAALNPEAQP